MKRFNEKITRIDEEHKMFIPDGEELDLTKKFFFRLFFRTQVEATQVWQVYHNGVFYDQLKSGPHILWNKSITDMLWGTWKAHRIDLRVMRLGAEVDGRVKGPTVPTAGLEQGSTDLACGVVALFQLACKIENIEKFLSYEEPLSVFYSSFYDLVIEEIGNLSYDQYASWGTQLRDKVSQQLRGGKHDSVQLIGMRIENVFVTNFEGDSEQDEIMLNAYKQIEKAKIELAVAKANRERDNITAQSYADQGSILNIAPSILALQNSEIGKALIERDADLRKLMVAAGFNPGVNVQPIADPNSQLAQMHPSSAGYLQAPQSPRLPAPLPQLPPSTHGNNQSGVFNQPSNDPVSGPLVPPQTYPMDTFNQPGNTYGITGTLASPTYRPSDTSSTSSPAEPPITPERREQELAELEAADYACAGKGQITPQYRNGQPIPGSGEWVLEVYAKRSNGYLTLVFHCPQGYPINPPTVQVKLPAGGGLRWDTPNTLQNWHPGRLLVEVAQEINSDIPD